MTGSTLRCTMTARGEGPGHRPITQVSLSGWTNLSSDVIHYRRWVTANAPTAPHDRRPRHTIPNQAAPVEHIRDRHQPVGGVIIELRRLRRSVDDAGYDGPIEVEIFNKGLWALPAEEAAEACHRSPRNARSR